MNPIKRIQIWLMRRSMQYWQEQAQEHLEIVIQYRARAAHVAKQIEEMGERV